jgi:hypothetical protein
MSFSARLKANDFEHEITFLEFHASSKSNAKRWLVRNYPEYTIVELSDNSKGFFSGAGAW